MLRSGYFQRLTRGVRGSARGKNTPQSWGSGGAGAPPALTAGGRDRWRIAQGHVPGTPGRVQARTLRTGQYAASQPAVRRDTRRAPSQTPPCWPCRAVARLQAGPVVCSSTRVSRPRAARVCAPGGGEQSPRGTTRRAGQGVARTGQAPVTTRGALRTTAGLWACRARRWVAYQAQCLGDAVSYPPYVVLQSGGATGRAGHGGAGDSLCRRVVTSSRRGRHRVSPLRWCAGSSQGGRHTRGHPEGGAPYPRRP